MATKRSTTQSAPEPTTSTLAEWERNSVFKVTGPSRTVFEMRTLTLDDLIADEALPDDLTRIALLEAHVKGGIDTEIERLWRKGDQASLELAQAFARETLALRDRIVLRAVIAPKVTVAKLAKLDPYDKAMIAAIAQRRLADDAVGRKVGADTLDSFREVCRFLAGGEGDPERQAFLMELSEIQ